MADLQTPFENPIAPTPTGASSGGAGLTGGYDFPDGRKESPNSVSGLPPQVTQMDVGQGAPGQVDMPPVASPGTIPTDAPKE